MSASPFADALAELGPQLGPHGGILVRGTRDAEGKVGAKAIVAVKKGDTFTLSAEFEWTQGAGYSAAGEIALKF